MNQKREVETRTAQFEVCAARVAGRRMVMKRKRVHAQRWIGGSMDAIGKVSGSRVRKRSVKRCYCIVESVLGCDCELHTSCLFVNITSESQPWSLPYR